MVVKPTQAVVRQLTLQKRLCNVDTIKELMTITVSGEFTTQI